MENVIVVVVIESKKNTYDVTDRQLRELFQAELLLLPHLLDARGRARSVCFMVLGVFFVCVCCF